VTPLHADDSDTEGEWYRWFAEPASSPALHWWLGDPPAPIQPPACVRSGTDWLIFPETGQAAAWSGDWHARWDLSPPGYLRMAAHGHLDALHLSLWLRDIALIIDPGTGAYYGDKRLRSWLASWGAHNGPHPVGTDFPRRLGPFLWGDLHEVPTWSAIGEDHLRGEMRWPKATVRREIRRLRDGTRDGWQVDDLVIPDQAEDSAEFQVNWQFAPGTRLEPEPGNPHFYHGERQGVRFTVGLDASWSRLWCMPERTPPTDFPVTGDLEGICSPKFRRIETGPRLKLTAPGTNPTMYRTTFLVDSDPE
jgi:hypothetical protein